jgi:small subunit ribosomal protein S5
MAERMEESQDLESTTVGIYRTAAVVKGGRRFSFAALVVVGDRRGRVGIGYGKAPGVPAAIEKAQKEARKKISKISLQEGTVPHPVTSRFGASSVKLVPASPGTGVIAGATVRAVLELAGVRDCLTKAYGSTNPKNLCKATFRGLELLQSKERIAQLRDVELEETEVEKKLKMGERFAPAISEVKASARGPENKVRGKGKGGAKPRGKGRSRGRDDAPAPAKTDAPAPAQTEAPAAEAPKAAPETPAAPPAPPAAE